MADFALGQFASSGTGDIQGQAFRPNVPGPNGSGSPGSATQVFLRNLTIGYNSSNPADRAEKAYIYAVELTSPDQIGKDEYKVAESDNYGDGTGLFGPGTYSRTFHFTGGAYNPALTYYAYFGWDQIANIKSGDPYSGGDAYDADLQEMDASLQFKFDMYAM